MAIVWFADGTFMLHFGTGAPMAATLSGSYEHIHAARNVASTIGTIQTVTVVILAAVTMLATAFTFIEGAAIMALLIAVVGGITAVAAWASFGWFEHTLLLLSEIAFNTVNPDDEAL